MENKNVKFSTGKFYCWENSDYEIEVLGSAAGAAFVQGWTLSTEKIHVDKNGNEFLKIGNKTYYAFCKA